MIMCTHKILPGKVFQFVFFLRGRRRGRYPSIPPPPHPTCEPCLILPQGGTKESKACVLGESVDQCMMEHLLPQGVVDGKRRESSQDIILLKS